MQTIELKFYLRIISKSGIELNHSSIIPSENLTSITLLNPSFHTGEECHVYTVDRVFMAETNQV